jgi:hypothetical protein
MGQAVLLLFLICSLGRKQITFDLLLLVVCLDVSLQKIAMNQALLSNGATKVDPQKCFDVSLGR